MDLRPRSEKRFQLISFFDNVGGCFVEISCVDLFCGAGALTHGLLHSGIKVTAGIDLDESCRYAFEHNNVPAKFFAADVAAVTGEMLQAMYPEGGIKLLAGCAPCQPFSSYSLGKAHQQEHTWTLLAEFGRLVGELLPEIVTMENVPKVEKHRIFTDFLKKLRKLDYHVSYRTVDCAEYGIPQTRRRLVLLASRLAPIELRPRDPKRDRRRTVRTTIANLPKLRMGEISTRDPLHRTSTLSSLNMRRLKVSVAGGTWRDWDPTLVAVCHRGKSGKTFPGVYGRMTWDDPAPTITTQFYGFGNGRFGHPQQDRALSLREGALLQTFPAKYRFVEPRAQIQFRTIGRMIGNAVPVRLGRVIGESIIAHVRSSSSRVR